MVALGAISDDCSTRAEIGTDYNGVIVDCGYRDLLTNIFPMPSISNPAEVATFLKPLQQKIQTPVLGTVQWGPFKDTDIHAKWTVWEEIQKCVAIRGWWYWLIGGEPE